MLELYLLRHADAARPSDVSDHERPLTEKGHRQASAMARYLQDEGITVDRVVVSTSLRTQQTWNGIVGAMTPTPEKIDEARIYEASVGDIMQVIRTTPDSVQRLMLIGHNPGFERVVQHVAVEGKASAVQGLRDGFEKGALAAIRFDANSWANLAQHSGFLERYQSAGE